MLVGVPHRKNSHVRCFQQREEVFDRIDLRVRLIAAPLQITTLPKDLPISFSFVKRRLCYAMFNGFAFARPMRSYLEYLNALLLHPKCKINALAKAWRRSTLLNELGHHCLAPVEVKFRERHG